MKSYNLSIGRTLNEENLNEFGGLELDVQWGSWPISVVFTMDEDDPESADNSVSLFERVYEKREYWLMMALHLLKVKLIEDLGDSYEEYTDPYRSDNSYDLFSGAKYSIFDELLAETELTNVIFGNEGEILFKFYDYARDCGYDVSGSETEKFTSVQIDY